MAQDPQIGGYLRPDEKKQFMEYLDQFHLRPAAVATLLIEREVRCERLPKLKDLYPQPPGSGRARVTARPKDLALKRAFEAHVAKFGMDPDPAASFVFRAELHERWLERSMRMESD